MTEYEDLFTPRQLTALTTFSNLVAEAQKLAEADAIAAGLPRDLVPLAYGGSGALAYGQAVGIYLAFVVDKAANLWSSLVSWMSDRGALRETFSRQAIPMVWDFAEPNPFSSAGGNFSMFVKRCADTIEFYPQALCYNSAIQHDARTDCGIRNVMISTDPPYYDNIGYADLSDFFYVWMRLSLRITYPELFQVMLVPKNEELIATPYRHEGSKEKAKQFFEQGMLETCRQLYKYSVDDVPVTIYYAYRQSDTLNEQTSSSGWETMLSGLLTAGFEITGTWPVRTESPGRSISHGTNALASSIVLVCRRRPEDAPQVTRRNFINTLRRELRPALQNLQRSNIAPVDMAQSAIGPGMAVFSQYKQVLEADGTPMSVRSALQIINQELDVYFNEQDGELDKDSRFCVELYMQYAFNDIKFGDADTLARAKNTAVETMAARGILYAQKGSVHLLERAELPEKVKENENCIWLLTQQLTRAMETGGTQACAKIIAPLLGANGERAKDLAYRLYTIAERKGWAAEAYAYNALVTSWPEIQSSAAALKELTPVQMNLFDDKTGGE